MDRRRFLYASAAFTLSGSLTHLGATGIPSPISGGRIVRNHVGVYTNRGGTMAYYLPDGAEGGVVVDTQFPEQATAFLHEVMPGRRRLDLLINTHHHGDHTGGNGIIAPLADRYVSHDRAKTNLTVANSSRGDELPLPLPSTTFADDWSVSLPDGREIVTARHFGPAHTGGDAVIHFENANVVHLGDLLFNRRFPYIDPAAGGNMIHWIRVLRRIRKTYDRDTVFVFGHAAESYAVTGDRDDVRSFQHYLEALHAYVRRERRRGTTLAALKAKTVTIPGAPEWRYGERLRDVNLEVMWAEVGGEG
ncbi:MBL fold metallo-hydrolase [Lewinella sp. JB7]|uniref:MBL fold metallo-hydrolase n=1 Tax=Lewinella sp. JB7 TaxID=2962887 RepID=UPI0020C9E05D|nr:MBL fold metallo-hydrolase [Lewinella sp. JB7]MCP9235547.1 MBL fold metallo-hydrolase [Lewinella sp. JB7]